MRNDGSSRDRPRLGSKGPLGVHPLHPFSIIITLMRVFLIRVSWLQLKRNSHLDPYQMARIPVTLSSSAFLSLEATLLILPRFAAVENNEAISLLIYSKVMWNPAKDRELWDLLARATSKARDLDCKTCGCVCTPSIY